MEPVLLIVIPLLMAFVSIILKKEFVRFLLGLVAVFNVGSTFMFEKGTYLIGGFVKEYGISLVLDDYSLIAVQVINIAFLLLIGLSFTRLKKVSTVMLISMAGLNGLMLTNDLFNLFVFLEVSSIAAYILTAQNKNYKATFTYLVLGVFGSSLYLLGIVLVYKMVGYLEFGEVAKNVTSTSFMVPVLLIFTGFAVEAKLLPFAGWVKGILGSANELTSVLIASIYSGTILFVFGRLLTVFTLTEEVMTIFVIIGLLTMVFGEVAAFSSKKLKELLAFSSIGQAGLVLLLFLNNLYVLAIMLIIGNVAVKLVLFSFATRLETDEINKLAGIFVGNKIIGIATSIASLSLLGVPFFYGFIVKLNLLVNLVELNRVLVVVAILFVSLVEAGYIIKMLVAFWNPGEEGETPALDFKPEVLIKSNLYFKLVLVVIAIGLTFIGIMPKYLYDYAGGMDDEIISDYPVTFIDEIGGIK